MNATSVAVGPVAQTTAWLTGFDGKSAAAANEVSVTLPPSRPTMPDRPLHRLGEVRRREGLPLGRVARRLGISIRDVQKQEQPSSDMLLSDLYRWQEALGVPLAELIGEPDAALSPPVQLRSLLLRVMKTARSIQQKARQTSVRRLIETLVDQLLEVMPELKDTGAWPSVGQRRKQSDLGQAFFRRLSQEFVADLEYPEEIVTDRREASH
jgi:transcriptional regulator with XRE-family HTH domain